MVTITAVGAVAGLITAIILIMKRVNPAYSLILGSVVGGLAGGADIVQTVSLMISGAQGMIPAILRILTAGVLAGVLIETGAASKIAETIVQKLGESKAVIAIVLSTVMLTMVGVFIDVAVITVAPIAMAIAKKTGLSRTGVLIAMIGGGKSGNIISPNPNAIAAADAFNVPLTSVMTAGIIPAVFGIVVSIVIAKILSNKGSQILDTDLDEKDEKSKPGFFASVLGPLTAIIILALRPLAGITIDPLIALPVGGVVGCLAMGKIKDFNNYCVFGLGVPGLNSAAMIHAGATVLDHLPHGSFFHATGGSVNMNMKERLALIPFESLVGLTLTFVSTIIYGVLF